MADWQRFDQFDLRTRRRDAWGRVGVDDTVADEDVDVAAAVVVVVVGGTGNIAIGRKSFGVDDENDEVAGLGLGEAEETEGNAVVVAVVVDSGRLRRRSD